ncbi:MAG: RusA family crossover junction endodeoxyribonuclease [Bacteroidota bacterium]
MLFLLPRPKSHFRSGRNAHLLRETAPRFPTSKPDADKLSRAVLEALTGVAYKDDAQVIDNDVAVGHGGIPFNGF